MHAIPVGSSVAPASLRLIAAEVEVRLDEVLDAEIQRWRTFEPQLAEPLGALRSLVMSGAKRLRPAFCHWGHVAAGGDPTDPRLVDAGAALELLQAFALLHDDVMDGSAVRRGARTAHLEFADHHEREGWRGEGRRFGEGLAVLVGDLAHVYADRLLTDAPVEAKLVWSELRIELNIGQCLDVFGTARADTDLATARRIARYKSGKYTVERPLHLGAALRRAARQLPGRAVGLRRSARRGVPAPRRPPRRLRRHGPHREAGRRRPARGEAHPAAGPRREPGRAAPP